MLKALTDFFPDRRFLWATLLALGMIGAALVWGIMRQFSSVDAANQIQTLKDDAVRMRILQPIVQKIRTPHPATRGGVLDGNWQPVPLPHEAIASLPDVFGELATEWGIRLISLTPQRRTLGTGDYALYVQLRVSGPWTGFQSMLAEISKHPAFLQMERVQIAPTAEGVNYTVEFLVAMTP